MMYLYHHLGLGDHIICNGMVREVVKQLGETTIFCKEHNYCSVSFMYRDLNKLTIIKGDDSVANNFLINIPDYQKICVGFHKKGYIGLTQESMDRMFYADAGIEYEKRWSSFYVKRDLDLEKNVFKKYGVKEGEYIFVHDDKKRDYIIQEKYISSTFPIIRPDKTIITNIFGYCYLLEHAAEVHCIDSCFRLLVEHLNIIGTLIFHQYSKYKHDKLSIGWGIPITKKNWVVYNA